MDKADMIINQNRYDESNIIFALVSAFAGGIAYTLADNTTLALFTGLLTSLLFSGWETRLTYSKREQVLLKEIYFWNFPVYNLLHLHQSAIKNVLIREHAHDFYFELLAIHQGQRESMLMRANYQKELEPKLNLLREALLVKV